MLNSYDRIEMQSDILEESSLEKLYALMDRLCTYNEKRLLSSNEYEELSELLRERMSAITGLKRLIDAT
jgi:hypothetical protein